MSNKKGYLFSNNSDRLKLLERVAAESFTGRPHGIIWVTGNVFNNGIPFSIPSKLELTKILLIFEGLPVTVDSISEWRRWAVNKGAEDVQIEIISRAITDDVLRDLISRRCGGWNAAASSVDPGSNREQPEIRLRSHALLGERPKGKDNPDLLTLTFGSMGELLTRIDLIRMRFRRACSIEVATREYYLQKIDTLLRNKDRKSQERLPEIASVHLMDHLPRLLLRGETGVGKTLIARYLQEKTGERPPRIFIPEFLNKEDMFEYDLFGYAHGAYTGGREGGQHGRLLENVGGVIFLDEIGEANATIQSKLLAYLDDYLVQPRGWQGRPFYCPTLVVAATNQDLNKLADEGKFRKDLLARFTDEEIIPPLRERVESFPFILDCLLQSDAINPEAHVQEIGQEAFAALTKYNFPKNFRELEDILRKSCLKARKEGRNSIYKNDLPFINPHPSV